MCDIEPLVPVIVWLVAVHHRDSEGDEEASWTLQGTVRGKAHAQVSGIILHQDTTRNLFPGYILFFTHTRQ